MHCETIPQNNGEKMEDISRLIEMDALLMGLECTAEKGRYQAEEIYDTVSSQKSDAVKLYEYDRVCIMADISLDYAIKADEELRKFREQFNILWDEIRGVRRHDNAREKMPLNQKMLKLEKDLSMNGSSAYRDAIMRLIDGCEDLEYITAVYSFAAAYQKKKKG